MVSKRGKQMTVDDVRAMLAKRCEVSQKAFAEQAAISAAYVCDVLKGRREPGEAICRALGVERVISYRKARSGKK